MTCLTRRPCSSGRPFLFNSAPLQLRPPFSSLSPRGRSPLRSLVPLRRSASFGNSRTPSATNSNTRSRDARCQDDGFRVGGLRWLPAARRDSAGKLPARGTRRFGAAAVSFGAPTGLCAGVPPPAVSFILLSHPTIYLNGYKVHVISLRSFLLMCCSSSWLLKTIRVIQGWEERSATLTGCQENIPRLKPSTSAGTPKRKILECSSLLQSR
nr:uncharacterized protein LOC117976282 [Pan paniscus]